MAKKPDLSIILGIRNAERTLSECLSAIFSQDYPVKKYELIIVDGNSTDSTLEIVKDFMSRYKNIRLMHNPKRFSEGLGMSKDLGVKAAKSDIVCFLDHDNIIVGKNWIREMLIPFRDKEVMASQSLLTYTKKDNNFIKYVNSIGVEDPFAVPFSLVSQVQLHPNKFKLIENNYYIYSLPKENILFAGANGCLFRKSVFKKINGYTRDLDVFTSMSEFKMKIAIPKSPRLIHKTSSNFLNFLRKKGLYFHNLLDKEYSTRKYRWIEKGFSNKIKFGLMIAYNLSIILPLIEFSFYAMQKRKYSLILHPFYLFYITIWYILITFTKVKGFLRYSRKK